MPVYNAEKFLAKAIESVLVQEEVRELILIEDNSPDLALSICEGYASRDTRVVLLRHPNNENRGAGASRNLGIRYAKGEYIAFLDADDQYVPDRFKTPKRMFSTYPDADGVYGHLGTTYYDEEYREQHLNRISGEITGMKEYLRPEHLLCQLLRGRNGHISLDTLVVKRELLNEDFLFDETLLQGQDTDFMYRLASAFRLYGPQEIDIVALRGVHAKNRVFRNEEAFAYRQKVLLKCIQNNFYSCNDRQIAVSVVRRYLEGIIRSRLTAVPAKVRRTIAFLVFFIVHPRVVINLLKKGRSMCAEKQMKTIVN
ncbi:MAG TPA: glycosyltransferase family A protein [Saprospiraceae bacterium]|nr:glycosyltransferase family A protein [Saprospiraceae bacterium]